MHVLGSHFLKYLQSATGEKKKEERKKGKKKKGSKCIENTE